MDVLWEKVSTHFLVNMGDLTTYTSDYQILDRGVICFVINNATIFARSCCDLISLFPCYIQTFMRWLGVLFLGLFSESLLTSSILILWRTVFLRTVVVSYVSSTSISAIFLEFSLFHKFHFKRVSNDRIFIFLAVLYNFFRQIIVVSQIFLSQAPFEHLSFVTT